MTQKSILFVCLGNICRSPMAEAVFNKIIEREKMSNHFKVDSAGMLNYHEGELADSRMRYHAEMRGYKITHRSRPVTKVDFDYFDWIIGMDNDNIKSLQSMAVSPVKLSKIFKMVDFCQKFNATHIPDPYYGGEKGFENVIDLLEDACEGLFLKIREL